jgi:hypothetical protein
MGKRLPRDCRGDASEVEKIIPFCEAIFDIGGARWSGSGGIFRDGLGAVKLRKGPRKI